MDPSSRRPRQDRATHLFIVGLPRTGSTLTRGIVNASPLIWVAGESRYLSEPTRLGLVRRAGWAERFEGIGDIRTESGLARVVAHIFGMRGKTFWSRLATRTDTSTFAALLRDTPRERRDLLDVAMGIFAAERPIRGEKTPHHVLHVPTLFEWFPTARVIHTIRDPRAVYASMRHKERDEKLTGLGRGARRLGSMFNVYSTLNLARKWRNMVDLHRAYSRRYPDRYTMVRFEDLVARPEPTAERLAAFIGVPYTPAMLGQVVHNSSFLERGAPTGIDPSVVDRWRDHIPTRDAERITRICHPGLEELGYRT